MALNSTTLATELKKIVNGNDEAAVRTGWAAAYTAYMLESAVLGVNPINQSVLAGAESAMTTAMTGISATTNTALTAAQIIVAAVKAYWTTILAAGASIWVVLLPLVPIPVTLPTAYLLPLTELAAISSLAAVFTANMVNKRSKDACYNAIAGVVHTLGAGATVTQATLPTPTPGIPIL